MTAKLTTEQFVEKAKQVHNSFYDYSLTEYIKTSKKVKIICPIHGVFEQTPNDHLDKKGCKKCANDKLRKIKPKKIIDFISQANNVHNNKYNYKNSEYLDAHTNIKIICPIHGTFEQTPHNHLKGHGCKKCSNGYSITETQIEKYLNELKINYISQYRFINCKNKQKLPFDFFLPDCNVCIEFDGAQHFEPIYGLDTFLKTIKNDKIKDDFCIAHNIKLIRMPYWEKPKIKEILLSLL